MSERNCTTCWHSVLSENTLTKRKKHSCLKNDGMEVNLRMCCEEWSEKMKSAVARQHDEREPFVGDASPERDKQ